MINYYFSIILKFVFYFLNFSAIILILKLAAVHEIFALDVKCGQTFPSSCFIGTAIDLPADEELTISVEHARLVTRFEIAPISDLKNFPSIIFQIFTELEVVTLNSANIKNLTQNSFLNANNMKDLHLKLNQLTTISKSVFTNAGHLEHLDLSGNQIVDIEDGGFTGLNNLRTLKLNGNRLKVLKTQSFFGLDNLEYLHLYLNKIEIIESNALALSNLKELFVGYNNLESLPNDIFAGATDLEVTEFSNNRLKHIGIAFSNCHLLYSLNLENNPLGNIDLMAFTTMRSLTSLSLNNTSFLFSSQLPEIDPMQKSALQSLNLGNNNLSNANLFHHLVMFPELQRLYLYNNKFTSFNDASQIKQLLNKLNTLDLIGNKQIQPWVRNNHEILIRDKINVLV